MTEALKELFDAYKHLPVGVMFFKEQKLFFINDHLRSILLLQNLGSDEIVQILGEMMGVENASHESLCDFLSYQDCFFYRDRLLQIERSHFENTDVFVIFRINDQSIKMIDETRPLRQMSAINRSNTTIHAEDEGLLLGKALGDWEKKPFPSIVLYKGIPIKGNSMIMHILEGKIAIKVDKKQLSAAQSGVQWLIGNRADKMVLGKIEKYDLLQSMVWLENLKIVSSGFHLRQVIRYGASSEDQIILSINGKKYVSRLHDISEKGIALETDNGALLVALSSAKGRTLDAQLILSNIHISLKAVFLYTIALEEGTQMKNAFSIGYDLHNGALLREWLNAKQLQLIKEVRTFVQMIPPPEENGKIEWVI